ncbi:hypothetical protein H311_02347, partial [Anncaliia algerae PRA109]
MSDKSILVIGAGGIGCELIKVLYLNKITRFTLVDYDIIELTNLNRQFLFSDIDIKKQKSSVASTKYKKISENIEIRALIQNINEFDYSFFRQFDVVFNCLDNNEARKYVNKRCLLTNTLLIDGGSTGFLGQSLYFDYKNECFDCIPEKIKEDIPVCTIRSYPTEFKHCLVWAKEVFLEKLKENLEIEEILKQSFQEKQNSEFFKKKEIGEKIKIIKENIPTFNKKEIIFDKDNICCMNLVYYSALIRAKYFNIEPNSFFESQSIIGNIIPSICTTNAIVASFMYLSYIKKRNFYIFKQKKFLMIEPAEKNPLCSFCSKRIFILKRKQEFHLKELFNVLSKHLKQIES